MKIICNTKALSEAAATVQRAVSSRASIPALGGILITAQEDYVTLCGYDLSLGIRSTIPANVKESGKACVQASMLVDILHRLSGSETSLEVQNRSIRIESEEAKFVVAGLEPSDYPEIPQITENSSIKISESTLKSMIRQTLYAVAKVDTRPVHTGSKFEIEDGKIRVISVDGYRIAIREEPTKSDERTSFIVPGKTLSEMMKLLGDNSKEIEMKISQRHILFTIGNCTVISRLLEGDFLDWQAAIPRESKTDIAASVPDFTAGLDRVLLLVTEHLKSPVRCEFADNSINLSCFTAIGRANDRLEAQITGDNLIMGFNGHYLLEALNNTECDEVHIQLNGPLSPMIISPIEGNSFLSIVLPVRLKEEKT